MSLIHLLLIFAGLFEKGSSPPPPGFACPQKISVSYRSVSPYIFANGTTVRGPIVDIVRGALHACCRTNFSISFDVQRYTKEDLINDVFNSTADMVMPVDATPGRDMFLAFPIVSIVESPGVIFYNFYDAEAGHAILEAIIAAFPLAIIMGLLVCIFGAWYWVLETIPTQNGATRSVTTMLQEIFEGVWWSFITMATVGYGDFCPKRVAARVLCYVWLLCGCVLISVFTASVTSILISICVNSNLEIRGTKVAVIEGSAEHGLAVKLNGVIASFANIAALSEAISKDTEIKGGLLDSYLARWEQERFSKYRIQSVIEHVTSRGVVLRSSTVQLRSCMQSHILDQQFEIYDNLQHSIPPLKIVNKLTSAEQSSSSLLDANGAGFYKLMTATSGVLLGLSFLGIIYDKYFLRRNSKADRKREEFKLLHHLKQDYHRTLQLTMKEFQSDLEKLQKMLTSSCANLEIRKSCPFRSPCMQHEATLFMDDHKQSVL